MSQLPPVFDERWEGFERDGTGPWIRRTCKDGYQFSVASENGKGQLFWLSKRRADGKGIDYHSRVIGQGNAWNRANDYAEKHGGWA